MRTLIVEHQRDLAEIWARFLMRQGLSCTIAGSEAEAYAKLREDSFDVILLDMELPEGTAIAVADFATYRNPDIPIIAVTARGFFSDDAILQLVPNARGLLRDSMRLEDMAALVQHYGGRYAADARVRTSSGQ